MTNTSTRPYFDRQLHALRDDILLMGSRVQEELKLALDALAALNLDKAREVYAADRMVNKARFDIEERCFSLIVTQQPAARDLRIIMAAMHMIVDLERMGDQAKGIAKAIPQLMNDLAQPLPERWFTPVLAPLTRRWREPVFPALWSGGGVPRWW